MTIEGLRYFLIDYESLQPLDLAGLQDAEARVLIFVGAQQHCIPFDLANALQALGERARHVKIGGTGRNALDFHLAFYLGELIQQDPDDTFRVALKDSGFDPLIVHLQARGVDVARTNDLTDNSDFAPDNTARKPSEPDQTP